MHGRRALAAAAAAGLLVSLFAPWYRETVVASGVNGLRTLTLTRSGWQAFSATELLILVVAVLTLLVLIVMPSEVQQSGTPDRPRRSGAIVAALGAIAFVVVLARLTMAPGTTKHALDETMVAIRWGIFLALACSAALTAAGLRLIRAPQHAARAPRPERTPRAARLPRAERPPRAERTSRQERVPRPKRGPRTDRAPRQDRPSRPDRAPRQNRPPRPDRTVPSATRTDGSDPSATAPSRRPDRTRPPRRADRPFWDEQGTGWLDLPD
jgi:MFS family permease